MSDHVKLVRVVVASPGDVQAERDALPGIIDELNRGVAAVQQLRLELARWETDAYPGFHPEGPQGLIEPVLRIDECDVLLGIFWKRFGTPTQDAQSGTEHEFLTAYRAWKAHGRPHIMIYFNQAPYAPKNRDEIEQWGKVLDFQQRFPEEGLWWTYNGDEEFEPLVRNHLTQFLRQYQPLETSPDQTLDSPSRGSSIQQTGTGGIAVGPGAAAGGAGSLVVGGDVHGDIYVRQKPDSDAEPGLRKAYLSWLMDRMRAIPLSGVDRKGVREESRKDLDLAAVYTALMTQRREEIKDQAPHLAEQREAKRLSGLAVLNQEKYLALLGDPGSGKSTFVNFVALCMAGEGLDCVDANLQVLRSPVPEAEKGNEEPAALQAWNHPFLLPVHVVLRDFVAGALSGTDNVSGETLWQFIAEQLPDTLESYRQQLRVQLDKQGGLLLLDGLDEVPEADQRREQVKKVVDQFVTTFPSVRVLVTSRTYAYQQQDWKLRGFAEAELAPFDWPQINSFVRRWYDYVGPLRGLSARDAEGKAGLLNTAIERNPRLHELATRPLLLTLMASLHAWRGGTLPDQREELYSDAVDLLLDDWENQKTKRREDGSYAIIQPSLAEWLKVDKKAVRQALNRLAFEAHHDQPDLTGTADIRQDKLVSALMRLHKNQDLKPARLIEYLRDRAGLLEPRGVEIYAFPHRTFQEYLAACHLTDDAGFPEELANLARTEPNRWREVTLLAAAKATRGMASAAWAVAEALCFEDAPGEKQTAEGAYWGALLAGQSLIETDSLSEVAERHRDKVDRIQHWLVCALQHGALPPRDRAVAGNVLAALGDPRFRQELGYLPDEPLLGFAEIPDGPFTMGEGDEVHEPTLPLFYMARYPVTVAQFRAFIKDSNYKPADANCLRGISNHPVVDVTWHDARKYCLWLTRKLQEWPGVPTQLKRLFRETSVTVTLPSEAEWEKAARGTNGLIYPWGNIIDSSHANYSETGIGTSSPVGSFTTGESPYGCFDMAGNVWEWTRSLWGTNVAEPEFGYPYKADDGRENSEAPDEVLRILRGGAFVSHLDLLRCAVRNWANPRGRLWCSGFRVVLLPSNSDF